MKEAVDVEVGGWPGGSWEKQMGNIEFGFIRAHAVVLLGVWLGKPIPQELQELVLNSALSNQEQLQSSLKLWTESVELGRADDDREKAALDIGEAIVLSSCEHPMYLKEEKIRALELQAQTVFVANDLGIQQKPGWKTRILPWITMKLIDRRWKRHGGASRFYKRSESKASETDEV